MIKFKEVTKIYDSGDKKVKAVDHINLHIEEGNICVFLGPSGCGKTTLLRMVNRLIPITSGTIEVNGKDINQVDTIQLRRSIGYVIQQNGLFPNMTIEDNIGVVPKMLGWDRVKIRKRADELLDLLGLNPNEYRNRFPWELSGGQQQRVGIARALAADPPIMLMDEPFGALDPIIREHIQNEFLRIQENVKKTILFVSHDIDEAIKLGSTIAIFKSGQIMQHGTPDEILSNPKNDFVSDFVGGERAIKRLTLLSVKDLIHKLDGKQRKNEELHQAVVYLETNLRTALSTILSAPSGGARVVDKNGRVIRVLTVSDFEILTGVHPADLNTIAK